MMEIIKGSLTVTLLMRVAEALGRGWEYSRLRKLALALALCFRESCTGRLLTRYINKEPYFRHSMTYRIVMAVFGLFDRLFGWIHDFCAGHFGFIRAAWRGWTGAWRNSLIYRGFTGQGALGTSFCGSSLSRAAGWTVSRKYDLAVFVLAAFGIVDTVMRKLNGTLGSVWDELFLIVMILLCGFKWIADRRDYRLKVSPMDTPIIVFISVMIFCLLVNSPDFGVSLEGFRAIVQYMLWYFVVIQLVKGEDSAKAITAFFVVIVALLAVYGVYQYAVGVEMPAGWTDHNEASVRTRVYAIFTSPNVFGSLLTLAAPMTVSMMFVSKTKKAKAAYCLMLLFILASLAFTFSRGAWLGFIAAVGIYVLIKDKRLIIPCIIAGLLVLVLVPGVGSRISYMLSPEYIASSLRGGRLVRWITGLKVLAEYPVLGCGLGHFGGAVAMNNNIKFIIDNQVTEAFYMDNYMLKTAVESGIVGFTAFMGLMYSVFIHGLRTVRSAATDVSKELSTGILAGLCGVIVHNLVENIFEVPMMTSLFWTFTAVLMGIWFYGSAAEEGTGKKDQSSDSERA